MNEENSQVQDLESILYSQSEIQLRYEPLSKEEIEEIFLENFEP